MVLTDYYRFEHLPDQKAKCRVDEVCRGGLGYPPLENKRNREGRLFLYCATGEQYVTARDERRGKLALNREGHISSVFFPDEKVPLAYGDMKNTFDAFLFIFDQVPVNGEIGKGEGFDVFVARGEKADSQLLYESLINGDLNAEIESLRGSKYILPKPKQLDLFSCMEDGHEV